MTTGKELAELFVALSPLITIGSTIAFLIMVGKFLLWWGESKEKLHKTDKVDESIRRIDENMSKIFGKLEIFEDRVRRVEDSGGLLAAHSPINLTDKGKDLANNTGMFQLVDENWGRIKEILKKECTEMNPYDLQEFLFDVSEMSLERLVGEDGVKTLKTEAFNKGDSIYSYARVVAIIIRNKYFDEKGISQDEVDKCDPNKRSRDAVDEIIKKVKEDFKDSSDKIEAIIKYIEFLRQGGGYVSVQKVKDYIEYIKQASE